MLHEMGIETGIDLERLIAASRAVQEVLGRPLGAHLLTAGPVDWGGDAEAAAFLRGMNLGDRRITNADLRAALRVARLRVRRHLPGRAATSSSRPPGVEAQAVERIEEGPRRTASAMPSRPCSGPRPSSRKIVAEEPFDPKAVAASKGKLPGVAAGEEAPPAAARKAGAGTRDRR